MSSFFKIFYSGRFFAQRFFAPALALLAMAIVIVISNILVAYPVELLLFQVNLADWLTYGAFSYPLIFLVTDLTNRIGGPTKARQVVLSGFALGVVLSLVFADPRIAVASGTAFLCGQFLDIALFHRLRNGDWWKAPLFSSIGASVLDTVLFFSIAFAGTGLPWMGWAIGDLGAKLVMVAVLLPAFRFLSLGLETLLRRPLPH